MGIDARILIRKQGEAPTKEQLKEWSWFLCEALGAEKFMDEPLALTSSYYNEDLPPGKAYSQDGDDILAQKNESLIEANVFTRFYGIGYERGDLLFLCALAEWCEANIPSCEVWYGGDSSGVSARPWPEAERKKLRAHLYSNQGRAYFNYSLMRGDDGLQPDTSSCQRCISKASPSRYGWGGNYAAYRCRGCGKNFVTKDGGQTWTDGKES
jgi:hypothetical protein